MAIIGPKDPQDSGLGAGMDRLKKHLGDLRVQDAEAKAAVLNMNAGVNFHPQHKSSHLVVENGRVELGSKKPGYFKLLRLPVKRLTSLYIYKGGRDV